jgi:predicted ATPase
VSETGFVGRQAELKGLCEGLAAALAGRGGLFLLTGEPGIGKTRLADELADRARAEGATILWGRCWEGDGAPAFHPWRRVIQSYAEGADAESLRCDLGRTAADVAQLVPEVVARLGDAVQGIDHRLSCPVSDRHLHRHRHGPARDADHPRPLRAARLSFSGTESLLDG